MLGVYDLQLRDGCKTSIGGDTQLAAVPVGKCTLRRIYVSVTASLRRRRVDTAHFLTHDTTERHKNKVVKTYGVVWREPDRDQFGLPVPVNPDHPKGPKRCALGGRPTQPARPTTGTSALAEQKRRGAAGWVRRARLARRAGGEDQPGEARAAHGQATSLAPAGH